MGEYLTKRVEFALMSQLSGVLNMARTAGLAAGIGFAVFSLLLLLVIPSIGTKTYRSLRDVAYALSAAALLDFALVAGVKVLEQFKSLVIYPLYLSDAVMKYVYSCLQYVCLSGTILFMLSLMVITVIWRIKRNNS